MLIPTSDLSQRCLWIGGWIWGLTLVTRHDAAQCKQQASLGYPTLGGSNAVDVGIPAEIFVYFTLKVFQNFAYSLKRDFRNYNLSCRESNIMEDYKRVPYPEHINRCQGLAKGDQCMLFAVEGGTNCMMHGGNKQLESIKQKSLKNYHLTMFRAKLERHSGSSDIKSLRDEVGILRMIMEERLNRCKDETDLILQSGPIADLVVKIEKLVSSCHRLEGSMGELLDKTSILQFANVIINIIGDALGDEPEKMNIIANRILVEVGNIGAS